MNKSPIKAMARVAKLRMLDGYKEPLTNRAILPSIAKEEKRVYALVVEILESDKVILNPLGLLIEHKIYDTLSSTEKERYVLRLSELYIRMTQKYLEEQKTLK